MVQKRGTKAINKLCVREILGLSFVCGTYFFEFRGWKQGRYACALPFSGVLVELYMSAYFVSLNQSISNATLSDPPPSLLPSPLGKMTQVCNVSWICYC